MGSTRVWLAVACGAVVVLGGACGDGAGQSVKATTPSTVVAVSPATPEAATPHATDAATPATPETATVAGTESAPATPSAQEVQALITSMTAQLQQTAAGSPETPAPTSDEIEAQLIEQLRQLGIIL